MTVYRSWGKRLLDLSFVIMAGPFVLPLVALVAIIVRWDLGTPIFFRQVRPGYRGVPFTVIKFRTMTSERDRFGIFLSDEKRLTKVGSFLRRLSLDEIPQLWNVFKGEMSLVGPRPLLMEYMDKYTVEQRRRHDVKPGISGWAQVNGRNAVSWEERFRLDLWYVDHCDIFLDIRVLAMTIGKLVLREGISHRGHATMPKFSSCQPQDNPSSLVSSGRS